MGTVSLVIKGLGSVNRLNWKNLLRELLLTVLSLTLSFQSYEDESPDKPTQTSAGQNLESISRQQGANRLTF